MNPYCELLKNRSEVAQASAASMFNSTTWRMFRKGESENIKNFLMRQIGDGRRLATCRSEAEYKNELTRVIKSFRNSFRMNSKMKHRRPGFGHASKVVDLYVKHLLLLRRYLAPTHRDRLEMHAHVPLDKWVLRRAWGHKQKRGDFRDELDSALDRRRPTLNELDRDDYLQIQRILANAARKKHIPAIAYDYFYAWRGE